MSSSPVILSRLLRHDLIDQAWFTAMVTNQEVTRHLSIPYCSETNAQALYERFLKYSKQGVGHGTYLYRESSNETLVGYGIICNFDWEEGFSGTEIGYILHPEFWLRVLGTLIAQDLMNKIQTAGISSALAMISEKNTSSEAIIQKLDFTHPVPSKKYPGQRIWRWKKA